MQAQLNDDGQKNKEIQNCIKQSLQQQSSLEGRMEFELEIDQNGNVNRLTFGKDPLNQNSQGLKECIEHLARKWVFLVPKSKPEQKPIRFYYQFKITSDPK